MVGMTVQIKGLEEAVKTFQNADKIIQHEFTRAMDASTKVLEGNARKLAPVGVSGEMRASITSEVRPIGTAHVEGRVGSPLPYALYVEEGTKPHYPPLEPLMLWVQRKNFLNDSQQSKIYMMARAIQRKIGAVGTPARKFFEAAFEITEPRINAYFDTALSKIVERLATE